MESKTFTPNREFSRKCRIKNMCEYEDILYQIDENSEEYWRKLALEKIDWLKPFDTVLDETNAPFYKWFLNGKLNVANQCVDRHLTTKKNKAAIIWESESGTKRTITYLQLYYRVNRMANLLKNRMGIVKGDRVIIYLPMIPEAVFAMLACAKIGAIHSVVFSGFSAIALGERIKNCTPKLVITADGGNRKGQQYPIKDKVDEALEYVENYQGKVLIVENIASDINYVSGRDYIYNDLVKDESGYCDFEEMDSEDPLFLLYTSGSTGAPKGIMHTTAGYILWAQYTMEYVFEVKDHSIFWCTADVGWITGHTYVTFGPLAAGATMVMYEGVMNHPNIGRWWKMIEEHGVNQFYTAPTAIRLLHKHGRKEPSKYKLDSLEVLGSVGEPINQDAWLWYYNEVGKGRCSIVDTWWQTETGGHAVAPLPGATLTKPSSATFPLPGIKAEVVDANGNRVANGEKGYLCITKPWPSMLRNVWNDPGRYLKTYFSFKRNGIPIYFSGDSARYDEDGYIVITGRTDDVINVSGHRLGTAEIEAVICHHNKVVETAVVAKPDPIKGEAIFAFVAITDVDNVAEEIEISQEINELIIKEIGAIARLEAIQFVPTLPKTRSGKIMRRLLKNIIKNEPITQDISTLENPEIINIIQNLVKGENV